MEGSERKWPPEEISAAIADAFQRYHDYLLDIAQQRGCSKYAAEDMVQEVFLIVVQNPDKFLDSTNRISWLISTLNHRIKHLKRDAQYASQLQVELEKLYSEHHEDQLALKLVYSGIIDERDFELLILYAVEGYSYEELSSRTGLEEANCRKHIQRARERFRKALGED